MQALFTLEYGEFVVADYLPEKVKGTSIFIPASAQEKGIDLFLHKFCDGINRVLTFQVKMSRAYYFKLIRIS